MLHSHELQVLCCDVSVWRDRGLWGKWLVAKTVFASPRMAMSRVLPGGAPSGHIASGRGGRAKTSQMKSLHFCTMQRS